MNCKSKKSSRKIVLHMCSNLVSKVQYHLTRAQRRITIEVFENMGTALVKR